MELTLLTESAHIPMVSLIEVRKMLEMPVATLRRTDDGLVAATVFRTLQERLPRDHASTEFRHRVDADHGEVLGPLEARDRASICEAAHAHLQYLRGQYAHLGPARVSAQ